MSKSASTWLSSITAVITYPWVEAPISMAVHAIVESQVALGDATVVNVTLARLMLEGLGRHDAIHAIGSVLIGIIFEVTTKKVDAGVDINAQYGRELAALTAASWRAQSE